MVYLYMHLSYLFQKNAIKVEMSGGKTKQAFCFDWMTLFVIIQSMSSCLRSSLRSFSSKSIS